MANKLTKKATKKLKTIAKNKSFVAKERVITVKNAEGEPDTTATILIQNNIKYTPKVSVIIPVYNVEEYLRECLDSVVNQTLKEIEIICVDDGSTDNSLEILKEYAKKDNRITVITQENLHAGVARNAGLSVAKGEYLSFLDSDDFFKSDMLEEMYNKIILHSADIIVCKTSVIDVKTGIIDNKKLDYSLQMGLLPNKDCFNAHDFPLNVFQFCQGFAWDKLFLTKFVKKEKLKFQNILHTNDAQFTFTAICLASRITYTDKRLVFKRHLHKSSLSANREKDPDCFISAIERIKANLEEKNVFKLVEQSFWNWAISLCLIQLKVLDQQAKEKLYSVLHKKFNIWKNFDNSNENTNRYRAIHWVKNQSKIPTITVAYSTNKKFFDLFLASVASILANKTFENINLILLSSDLTDNDITSLQKLKEKYNNFEYKLHHVSDDYFNDFPLVWTTKETWYRCLLADKFPEYDKILYLDCDTIVRKSLLSLWEIDLSGKLIGAVEDISRSKDRAVICKLKDNFYFNAGVLLMNTKEWRKEKLFDQIVKYVKNNEVFEADQGTLNVVSDMKKIQLDPQYNFMEVWWRENISQYDKHNEDLYNKKDPTIVHFTGTKPNKTECKNSFKPEFLRYYNETICVNEVNKKSNVIISLTSYPARIGTVNQTIESLLNQTMKADKVILWLAPEQFPNREKDLPKQLLDLRYKGLTIDWYHDIRSYKKLIPTLQKYPDSIIVTADDDIIYESDCLEKLYKKHLKSPHSVIAHRTSRLYINDAKIKIFPRKYYAGNNNEYLKELRNPSIFNMQTGCKAVLYPVNCFYKDILNEDLIKQLAPTNDDQWFWAMGALNGYFVEVPEQNDYDLKYVPGTQDGECLWKINDRGDKLYFRDLDRIIEHYPSIKSMLHKENNRNNRQLYNIANNNVLTFNCFKDKQKQLGEWYFHEKKEHLNIIYPKTYNEKLQWLKIYNATPIKTKLADKVDVRDWVSNKIGDKYLVPIYGVYNSFDEIDFDKLPNQFVIKTNHGSGWNIIVPDKTKLDLADAKEKIDRWMSKNYAFAAGFELHYRDIKPKIMIEAYIDPAESDHEIQIWCFSGEIKFVSVESIKDKKDLVRGTFYPDGKPTEFAISPAHYKKLDNIPDKKAFNKALKLAKKMLVDVPYVRIDFIEWHGSVLFREMTFTSGSGLSVIEPTRYNRILGDWIKLPKKAYDIDTGMYYKLPKIPKERKSVVIKPYLLLPYYMLINSYFKCVKLPFLKCKKNIRAFLYSHSNRGRMDKILQSIQSVKNDMQQQINTVKAQQNELVKQINNNIVVVKQNFEKQSAVLSDKYSKLLEQQEIMNKQFEDNVYDIKDEISKTNKEISEAQKTLYSKYSETDDKLSEIQKNFESDIDSLQNDITVSVNTISKKVKKVNDDLNNLSKQMEENTKNQSNVLNNAINVVSDKLYNSINQNHKDLSEQITEESSKNSDNLIKKIDATKNDLNSNIESDRMLYFNPGAVANLSELGLCDIDKTTDFENRFKKLLSGLSAESAETVIKIIHRLQLIKKSNSKQDLFTQQEKVLLQRVLDFNKEIVKVSDNLYAYKKYLLPINHFEPSVFLYNHGIEKLDSIENFKNKDILDIGGFIGDSVLMLSPLTTGKIYSFEATTENYDLMLKTIELNNIKNAVPVHAAVGDKPGEIELRFNGSASSQNDIMVKNPKYVEKCPVIKIDDYVREHNVNVGLIKVDIEGAEQAFLRGAKETICSQKPTLLISIYHNVNDFLDIKPMIESWGLGYKFKIFKPAIGSIESETLLICEQ